MDHEKMTEEILRRRDEILRRKKRDTLRLAAAMSVTWVAGAFIGTGMHYAFFRNEAREIPPVSESITLNNDPAAEGEETDDITLSHEPIGDFGFLGLPEGYTSSWAVDEEKLGGQKTIIIGDDEIRLYYNYSVDVNTE